MHTVGLALPVEDEQGKGVHSGNVSASPRWLRLGLCAAAAAMIWFGPMPEGLADRPEAWRTFAVFVGVVAGFLLQPMPMAPVVLLGLTMLVLTGSVKIDFAIRSGFGNTTVWLVISAFLIAGAVEQTGLGKRLALYFLARLGRSMVGLGYGIAATELVLGPFVPSNTARGGGIISPIVQGLARSLGARVGEESSRTGAYLTQTASHSNLVCSAMFLTAMAGNTLLSAPAKEHFGVEWDFGAWLKGSIVPGLVGLSIVPIAMRFLEPPETTDVSTVRARVADDLRALGSWTPREISLVCVLVGLLIVWSQSKSIGQALGVELKATTVALAGVVAIVLTGTLPWRKLVQNPAAWDALMWLGGFMALAASLGETGFTEWFQGMIGPYVAGMNPIGLTIFLALIYFGTMFFFSQLTAHISALAGIFLALASGAGAPALLAIGLFSYFSCLCGAMTPWSSGPVMIYFGFGYVTVGRWIRNGFAIAILEIAVWLSVGMLWWKFLGWW